MLYLAGILLLALLSPTYGNPLSRSYSFNTYNRGLIIRNISGVKRDVACQGHCYEDQDCMAFTYHNDEAGDLANLCSLFSYTSDPVPCNYTCRSGPKECDMCSDRNTTCTRGLMIKVTNITTETKCQLLCYAASECSTYTWFTPMHPTKSRECHLYSSCDNTKSCEECLTGPDDCDKCFPPENVKNGVWDCPRNDMCYLRCDPGFLLSTPEDLRNYCHEGVWEHPPGSVSCAPGVALLYGGAGITTTEAYSSNSTCSIKLPDHQHSLTGHSMEYIGVPIMCGGRIGVEIAASNKCWVLEDNQAGVKEWREYEHSLQQQRNFGSSIEEDGYMWLIGGSLSDRTTEKLYPGLEWELGVNLTAPLAHGCAVQLSWGTFLVINAAATEQGVSTVTKYFTYGIPAEQLPSLKTPRSNFACSVVKNETFTGILVAGGFMKDEVLSTSELFDLELGEWIETGSLNIARQDFEMLVLEGGVHAFGGLDGKKLNSVEKFNLSTGEWEITGNLTEPRGTFAATLVPGKHFCGDEETTATTSNSTTITTADSTATTATSNSTTPTTTTSNSTATTAASNSTTITTSDSTATTVTSNSTTPTPTTSNSTTTTTASNSTTTTAFNPTTTATTA